MARWSLSLVALALAGCASSPQVSFDYDPQADFSGLQGYRWLASTRSKSDDATVDYNSLLASRVRAAVDAQLADKGYRLVDSAPDFQVAFHVSVDRKVSVTYLNELYGYGPGWGWSYRNPGPAFGYPGRESMVSEYNEGTLIIDIVDAAGTQLLWRGTATDEVYPDLSPEARQKRISGAVAKILRGFPPPGR
jgi:hypothetical protein